MGSALVAAACGGDAQGPTEPAEPIATSVTTSVATTGSTTQPTATAAEPATTTEAPVTTMAEDQPPAPATTADQVEEPVEKVTTTVAATTAATEPAVVPEGPPVPAVTLELDDGTTFVSTEAARPVLYLFWAEW